MRCPNCGYTSRGRPEYDETDDLPLPTEADPTALFNA